MTEEFEDISIPDIKRRRALCRLTQRQAAELIGISESLWRDWENGIRNVKKHHWALFIKESDKLLEGVKKEIEEQLR